MKWQFPSCERARNAEMFVLVSVDPLQRLIGDIFRAEGCSAEESGRIASGLMSASLTGHESHGVLRTPRYVWWLQEGHVKPDRTLKIRRHCFRGLPKQRPERGDGVAGCGGRIPHRQGSVYPRPRIEPGHL